VPRFPEWFLVRRPLRPLVISLISLALALGASVGLAAPAGADSTGFTGQVESLPVWTGSADVLFDGTRDAGSTFSSIALSNAGNVYAIDPAECTYPSAISWSCDWVPPADALQSGEGPLQSYITMTEQNSDGTTSTDVLTFLVWNFSDGQESDSGYAVQDFQFTPGGVDLTTTPSAAASNVGTSFYQAIYNGEGYSYTYEFGCPDRVNDNVEGSPADSVSATPGAVRCEPSLLPQAETSFPVLWEADAVEGTFDGTDFASTDNTAYAAFAVLDAPIISSAVVNADHSVTVAGTGGFDGQAIDLLRNASPGQNLCRVASVARSGAWTCTTAVLANGSYALSAVNEDVDTGLSFAQDEGDAYAPGALSAPASAGTLVVGTALNPPSTTPGDITPVWSFTVSGDLTDLHPGDTITVTGLGLPAGTTLDVVLHSTPTDLGTVVAAADGTFTQTDTIPQGIDIGPHTIIVTATGPGLVTTTQNQPITVTSQPASGSGGKTNPVAPKPTATHDNGGSANGQGIAPNILTRALTPIADVAIHPNKIVSALEIGLVLLLLAVLPAHLLNATIAEQSDRFERRFGKLRTPGWLFRLGIWFRSAPVAAGIAVTLATAILFGFADPKFGFTLASLRLILAAGIALFLVGYVANALTGLVARVQWNIVAAVSTRPYGLILTIVGVIISRALHFSPGFLIGLILGLTIQGKSAAGFAWRTVVLRSSIVLIMAIAAWIGYSTLTLGGNEGGTFWSALIVETLVAITTEGVVALLVELLPLRFLEGERVYAHSRVLWGIFYVLTVVVFVLAVVPWEGNWDALHGSLWIWIVVLAIFAAICVGIYIYFRRFAKPLEEEPGSEKVALGETVSGDKT
jgi:hypothetical protein